MCGGDGLVRPPVKNDKVTAPEDERMRCIEPGDGTGAVCYSIYPDGSPLSCQEEIITCFSRLEEGDDHLLCRYIYKKQITPIQMCGKYSIFMPDDDADLNKGGKWQHVQEFGTTPEDDRIYARVGDTWFLTNLLNAPLGITRGAHNALEDELVRE